MNNRTPDPVMPSITLTAFSCPHCGAFANQTWFRCAAARPYGQNSPPKRFPDSEAAKKDLGPSVDNKEAREKLFALIDRVTLGLPFIGDNVGLQSQYLYNVDVSECFNCRKLAIWVGDNMMWPHLNNAPPPNNDLPDEVAPDYREAGDIINASPRGAAALLRLAIQKLCKHLGQPGKNINDDIAALVKQGLDPRVQKMLDVVRVIGNNAVHPGEIDLRDDRPTAERLFILVNMITDIMISQPKAIDEMYAKLGDNALAAIERRDRPKK